MISQFWQGKKVFITGHTGFKGSWLCLWLNALGAEVSGYALEPSTDPSLFDLCQVDSFVNSTLADVRDGSTLRSAMKNAAPEIVVHLAAQPLVRESYNSPADTYATNVMGTVNLFEAVRCCSSVRAVVNVTTDKCYENKEWLWSYRENEPMGGYDPYSSSKGCSELVTASYRQSFFSPTNYDQYGVAVASARAGNVIGGGDWAVDRLICDCVRSLLRSQEILVRSPSAIRPWQHVLEPLSGYLLLAQRLYEQGPTFAEAWNFGPDDADVRPVAWVVQRLCELWGEGATYRIDQGIHPHEANYLKLDCSKAKSLLGWQPKWSLQEALNRIVDWTKGYQKEMDVRAICLAQIDAYQKGLEAGS